MKPFIVMIIFLLGSNANADPKDIYVLKEQVLTLTQQNNQILRTNEAITNNRLARYQAKLLIKTVSYEICIYLRNQGVKRSVSQVEKIVEVAYWSSWIFTDLGKDHIDRFLTILQWAKDESGFVTSMISHWKAGTYLKSIRKKVLRDSTDYGAFQINEFHLPKLKNMSFLYESGIVKFKINRVRQYKDLMDINTNCVGRCMIETDRKARGWEWQHAKDVRFKKFLFNTIAKIERDNLYNRRFSEKYYSLTPIKTYSAKNFSY